MVYRPEWYQIHNYSQIPLCSWYQKLWNPHYRYLNGSKKRWYQWRDDTWQDFEGQNNMFGPNREPSMVSFLVWDHSNCSLNVLPWYWPCCLSIVTSRQLGHQESRWMFLKTCGVMFSFALASLCWVCQCLKLSNPSSSDSNHKLMFLMVIVWCIYPLIATKVQNRCIILWCGDYIF